MQSLIEYRAKGIELSRPNDDAVQKTMDKTKLAMEKILKGKIASTRPSQISDEVKKSNNNEAQYIRYTPQTSFVNSGAFNSGAKQRIIRMVEAAADPMDPPKYEHKKVPVGPPSPPAPVMHSPSRKLTVKDQLDWKIPPCISNWKNARGFTIPLDKRLAADGRGLIQATVSDNHAKFAEALYIADRTARDELNLRNKVQKKIATMEKQREDERLRKLAAEVHAERVGLNHRKEDVDSDEDSDNEKPRAGESTSERESRMSRENLRRDRLKERKRDIRLETLGKKTKTSRDMDRDVSERIALGMPVGKVADANGQFDSRLFNQSEGMNSGFGADDGDNVYTKSLRPDTSQSIYRPKKADDHGLGTAEEEYNKLKNTSKFKPDKGFSGTDAGAAGGASRSGPVSFEAERRETDDPFGINNITKDISSGSKRKRDDKNDGDQHRKKQR